jgi:Predicted acetyltransferase
LPADGHRVRTAVAADAEAVFALVEQLGSDYDPDRRAFERAFTEAVGDPDRHLLLVAADGSDSVVGYCLTTLARLLYTNGESAQLQELVVDQSSRDQGIGSELVGAVEDECRARGVRQLTVASSRGASFYERLDYRSTADFLKKSFED